MLPVQPADGTTSQPCPFYHVSDPGFRRGWYGRHCGDPFEHGGEAFPLCHRIRAAHRGVVELRDDAVAGGLGDSFDRATLPLPPRRSPIAEPAARRQDPPAAQTSQTTRPVHPPRSCACQPHHHIAGPAIGANPPEAQTTPMISRTSVPRGQFSRPIALLLRRAFGASRPVVSSKHQNFGEGLCVRRRQFDRGAPGGGLARSSAAIYG